MLLDVTLPNRLTAFILLDIPPSQSVCTPKIVENNEIHNKLYCYADQYNYAFIVGNMNMLLLIKSDDEYIDLDHFVAVNCKIIVPASMKLQCNDGATFP